MLDPVPKTADVRHKSTSTDYQQEDVIRRNRTLYLARRSMDQRTGFSSTWSGFTLMGFILMIHISLPSVSGALNGGSILTAADDLIQPAANWLLDRSKQTGGNWGPDTPRALLALLRVTADRSAAAATPVWDANSLQGLIQRQEFDIQILLFLLRHRGSTMQQEQANTLEPSRSLFALTLTAMCRNPRDFYGQDILAPIMALEEDDERSSRPLQPFTFAFNALAVCAGGGHLKRRHVVKLLESISQSPSETHSIDLLAMVALATSCLARSNQKYRHLQDYLEQPLKMIAAQQQPDGSFEHNIPTTALAIQALKITDELDVPLTKPISVPAWRPDAAVDWLRSQQKSDGSFGDTFSTTEVLLALATQSGYGFLFSQCLTIANQTVPNTTTESAPTTTTIASAGPLGGDPTTLVKFTYVVWIGQNRSEVYAIQLTVPANSSFYEAMKVAAEADPRFEFSASIWPNGHYIHTIGGHRDQYIGFHFWLLLKMDFMPDPQNPPPATHEYVAVAGVDDMYPQNGEYYLFWYKDV